MLGELIFLLQQENPFSPFIYIFCYLHCLLSWVLLSSLAVFPVLAYFSTIQLFFSLPSVFLSSSQQPNKTNDTVDGGCGRWSSPTILLPLGCCGAWSPTTTTTTTMHWIRRTIYLQGLPKRLVDVSRKDFEAFDNLWIASKSIEIPQCRTN